MDCPDENLIGRVLEGAANEGEAARVHAHAVDCPQCSSLLSDIARLYVGVDATSSQATAFGGPLVDALPLVPGTRVGRYVVEDIVGSGGMGVVYRALDPELSRHVALKLVRFDSVAGGSDGAHERLLGEAQALARLSHPSVVTIYDVGTHEGQLFFAMELIDGDTLAGWIRRVAPTRTALLDAFESIGAGLLAAHRRDLVHRDVKPGNVLVGGDGRVRLTDFSLAHVGEHRALEVRPVAPSVQTPHALDERSQLVTQTGLVVGTPRYMSPEQMSGGAVDARSDQFSFCVMLAEALAGTSPAAKDGDTTRYDVPRWLQRVLDRGRAQEPQRRFPNMDALLLELRNGRRRRRRFALWAGIASAAVLATVAGRYLGQVEQGAVCGGAAEAIATAWNEPARARVGQAFAGSEAGRGMWPRLEARLQSWAESWTAEHTRACEATRVHRHQSDDMLDLRVACLNEHRAALAAVLEVLATGGQDLLTEATKAVDGLPRVEACRDPKGSLLDERDSPQVTAALARAKANFDMRRFEGTRAALDEIEGEGLTPVMRARVAALQGALDAVTKHPDAEQSLSRAIELAAAAGVPTIEVQVWARRVWYLAVQTVRPQEAREAAIAARGALARAPRDPELEATVVSAQGFIFRAEGRHQEAIVPMREAYALRRKLYGPSDPRTVRDRQHIAMAEHSLGRFAEAIDGLLEVDAAYAEAYGPRHPERGYARGLLATVYNEAGRYDDALKAFAEAREVLAASVAPTHAWRLSIEANYHMLLDELGRDEEARAGYVRILEDVHEAYGRQHVYSSILRQMVAMIDVGAGEQNQGLADMREAVEDLRQALGPEHSAVASSDLSLADLLWQLDRHDEACTLIERAVQRLRQPDAKRLSLAEGLRAAADCDLERGRVDAAQTKMAEVAEIRAARPGRPVRKAEDEFVNLRIDHSQGRDVSGRLKKLREALRELSPVAGDLSKRVARWSDALE